MARTPSINELSDDLRWRADQAVEHISHILDRLDTLPPRGDVPTRDIVAQLGHMWMLLHEWMDRTAPPPMALVHQSRPLKLRERIARRVTGRDPRVRWVEAVFDERY